MVYDWAVETFGSLAQRPPERAARLLEEALEVAQSLGVPRTVVDTTVDRVYSRPVGTTSEEIGSVVCCAESLAESLGLSADSEANRWIVRLLDADPDVLRKKHAEKIALGISNWEKKT